MRMARHPDVRDRQNHENQGLNDTDDRAERVEGERNDELRKSREQAEHLVVGEHVGEKTAAERTVIPLSGTVGSAEASRAFRASRPKMIRIPIAIQVPTTTGGRCKTLAMPSMKLTGFTLSGASRRAQTVTRSAQKRAKFQ